MSDMKIGILTFHSQLNYGGVLQCWALKTALEKMRHEVVVIDRWPNADNSQLERGYDKWGLRQWVKFWLRTVLGLGDDKGWLRVRRTKGFIRKRLNLTPYHFVEWKDAPQDLGVDLIIVGSDQVWHCGDWGDPRVYLLGGVSHVSAVAYAASFGFASLPQFVNERRDDRTEARHLYVAGMKRFAAISCREAEGVTLCEQLGASATHVLDPTLLLDVSDWRPLVRMRRTGVRKRLTCYFLSVDILTALPELLRFVEADNVEITVLLDSSLLSPLPTNVEKLRRWWRLLRYRWSNRLKVFDGAGPCEFVSAIANADCVLSDSFHALMFSIAFEKNVRILKPQNEMRSKMFSRITEIAGHMKGSVVAPDVTSALDSFKRGETVSVDTDWLAGRREQSLDFLRRNIG